MRISTPVRLAIVGGIPALLFACIPAPPSTDLFEHVHAIGVLRGLVLGDPAYAQHYQANLLASPYLVFHLVGMLLALMTGSALWATRVLLVATAVATPLAYRHALRTLGADERLAWFGVLPFYSRALSIGFLPYLASIPIGFLLLGLSVSVARSRAKLLPSFKCAFVASVLFYCHVSSFVLFVPMAVLVAFCMARPRWMDFAWLLLPGAVAGRFFLVGRIGMREGVGLDDAPPEHMPFVRAVMVLPLWLFDHFKHRFDDVAAVPYWLLLLGATAYTSFRVLRGKHRVRLALALPALVCTVVWLCTPFRVGAATFLNVRLAPVVVLFYVIPLRVPPLRRFTSVLALSCLAYGGVFVASSFLAYLEDGRDLVATLRHVPPRARVLTLNFDRNSRLFHIHPYLYGGSLAVAEAGGAAGFSFASLPHWSVHYRRGNAPPPHRPFWVFRPCDYRNGTDGAFFDFVVVRGTRDPFGSRPAGPIFNEAFRSGRFTLYAKDPVNVGTGADASPCGPSL